MVHKESDENKLEAVSVALVLETGAAFDVAPVCNPGGKKVALLLLLSLVLRGALLPRK